MSGLDDAGLDHLREVLRDPALDASLRSSAYELLEEIGRGGMGIVYRAHDPELDRDVALKVVRSGGEGEALASRLRREARILAQLEHPGIIPVHEVGVLTDGRTFAAMKLVQGRRLADLVATPLRHNARASPRELDERLRLFLKILEAVGFAHSRGIVHCDLKPSNVMVGAFGEVLVLDWGLARRAGISDPAPAPQSEGVPGGSEESASGAVLGTPGYMAPEQERGERHALDARTDVFALGAILADLVGGEAGPPALVSVARRARAASPEERYPDAAALASDIERFMARQAVAAHRERPGERLRRWYARYEAPILLVVAYLLLRVLFAVWPRP
jgi:serine/threonine protein kinase